METQSGHQDDGNDHPHDHEPEDAHHGIAASDKDEYVFRCTYCNNVVMRPLPAMLTLLEVGQDELVVGKMYRFGGCYCGQGKFVICEPGNFSVDALEKHLFDEMEH